MSIAIGNSVVDSVTGFAGTVTGLAEYVGSRQAYVEAPAGNMDSSQREPRGMWFALERLEVVDSAQGPGVETLGLRQAVSEQALTIETLQGLLDSFPCLCRLGKMCPKHDPARPPRNDG